MKNRTRIVSSITGLLGCLQEAEFAFRNDHIPDEDARERLDNARRQFNEICKLAFGEQQIVITYPPDYDGELHVGCLEKLSRFGKEFLYSFTHAAPENATAWDTLVIAAKAILAQDERRKAKALREQAKTTG